MADYDVDALRAYIQRRAAEIGIDPQTATRVAQSEGLGRGIWQSNVTRGGRREPSYGPWQFLVGGGDTGFPTGMGNSYMEKTGLDPRDPANVNSMTDFALNRAKQNGWADWYGARDSGIGRWQGITNRGGQGLTLNSNPVGPPAGGIVGGPMNGPAPGFPSVAGVGVQPAGISPMDGPKGMETTTGGKPSFWDNLKGAFKDPKSDLMAALGGFAGSMGQKEEQPSAPIQSVLPSMEAADAARTQGASQLMATLLAAKKKKAAPLSMGLNLMGMI